MDKLEQAAIDARIKREHKKMNREEAVAILREPRRIGANLIRANDEETTRYNAESLIALEAAIKALEQVSETEQFAK